VVLLSAERARGSVVVRHYATNRRVVGSRPDEVDFSNLPNPSGRSMALGSTQPVTETRARNLKRKSCWLPTAAARVQTRV
jgi:hypothetical protein